MPSLRLDFPPPLLPESPTAGDCHFCPGGQRAGGVGGAGAQHTEGTFPSQSLPPLVPWPWPQVAPDPAGCWQSC